jgi:D-serine deaminase-like pyridoxal phosphate-dependent protein
MDARSRLIGSSVDALDTPALCIDLDVLEANIARMAGLCREHGVAWRPHSKAVKTPEIVRQELAAGAIGATCAKLGEAEVMAAGGIRDLLVANEIAGSSKIRRLLELRRSADPMVCVDHPHHVAAISAAAARAGVSIRLLIEVNIGLNRAGVPPGEPAVSLAQSIARQPGVELAGIMGYEGHLLTVEDQAEKARRIREALGLLVETRDLLLRRGLPCPIVSAGGTGSIPFTLACPGITELQAGGVIFMDAFYRYKCRIEGFGFALKLLTTIVSRPVPERAIIDAGRKAHHADHHPSIVEAYENEARLVRLSAEHGEYELSGRARELKIGDRLWLIPGYSDMTNVLHDEFVGVRRGQVEAVWPLLARGKLQ